MGLAVLALCAQLGLFAAARLDRSPMPADFVAALLPAAIALAAVAVVTSLLLVRLSRDPLAAILGLAVAGDAILFTSELMTRIGLTSKALPIPHDARTALLFGAYPALLLAGAAGRYALGGGRHPHDTRRARLGAGAVAALAVAPLAVLLVPMLREARAVPVPKGFALHAGVALVELAALGSCWVLFREGRSRLAGFAALSLVPAISAWAGIAFGGVESDSAHAAAYLVRALGYALIGLGAWSDIRAGLSTAISGRTAMHLAERIRSLVLDSAESETITERATDTIGRALGLREMAVLLRDQGSGELRLAGAYAAKAKGAGPEDRFGPRMRALAEDRAALEAVPDRAGELGSHEAVFALRAGDQDIGVVIAARRPRQPLSDADLLLLDIACGQLAMGLVNTQLLWESQGRLNRAEALRRLAVETNRDIGARDLAALVVQQARGLTGMQHGELYLLDKEGEQYARIGGPLITEGAIMPPVGICRSVLRSLQVETRRDGLASMAAPLIAGPRVVGVLAVHSTHADITLTEEEEVALQALADQSVVALERARLAERVARAQEEMQALYAISKDSSFAEGLQDGLRRVAELTAHVLACDLVTMLLLDEPGTYRILAACGQRTAALTLDVELADDGLLARIASGARPVALGGMAGAVELGDLAERMEGEGVQSSFAVPLKANGEGLGVLLVCYRARHALSAEEEFLAERISRQTAIAIQNVRLLRREQDAVRKLRELDDIKSSMIRSASHELRTPLSFIKGYTELLLETTKETLSPRQHGQLQNVGRQTDHVLGIVEDIITAAALQDGGIALDRSTFEIPALVEGVRAQLAEQAAARGITLAIELGDDLPPLGADRPKLEQVLLKMLGNALKFAPEGGAVGLSVRREGGGEGDARTRWLIADDGPGVAPGDRERLFQLFHRGSGVVDDAVPGAGLGLAIASGIVAAHGGRMGLDPASARGAHFWFTLPGE